MGNNPTRKTRQPRKGMYIIAHKGDESGKRTISLPGGKVTPLESERIKAKWKASGLSWSDYIVRLHE